MKKEKDFIKWIEKQIKFYSPILGIDIQRIEVKKGEKTNYLEISCPYPYLEPTIKYSTESFENWKKKELRPDRILHELCHTLTDPLYIKSIERYVGKYEIEDERERLTDKISIIIRNLIKKEKCK